MTTTSGDGTQEEGAGPLATALTNEHHAIDGGIERFVGGISQGGSARQLAEPLVAAMAALRRHIYLEEEIIFPRIRRGPLMMPVMVMLREHGEIWREMDALDALLKRPEAAEEELVAGCRRMLELLENHNLKEEPVIYTHVDADLDWAAQAQLQELLATGELPKGWVCEKA